MIEIKSRYTGDVIFKSEKAETVRGALIEGTQRGCSFFGANLAGANLARANLAGADLAGAKGSSLAIAMTRVAPPEGEIIGWKKCRNGVIVKLRVPPESKRSNAFGRKCRAEFIDVLEVFGESPAVSQHDSSVTYSAGLRVTCDKWDENFQNECSGGIHFFITREEAENY